MVIDYSKIVSLNQDTLTKICNLCGLEKHVSEFRIRKNKNGEYTRIEYCCKECKKVLDKGYRYEHKEALSDYFKNYNIDNKEKIAEKGRTYREKNSEKFRLKRIETKEARSKLWKKWSEENKEYRKEYKKQRRALSNRQEKERRSLDENFKLKSNLRGRIYKALVSQDASKHFQAVELLGCSIDELKAHVESQFQDGMSWANHSVNGWHLDHKIPCSYFDLTNPEEQKKCFHYTNLQPLWASQNLIKGQKVVVFEDGTVKPLEFAL